MDSKTEILKAENQRFRESEILAGFGHWEYIFKTPGDWLSNENYLWWSEGTYRIFEMRSDEFDNKVSTLFNLIHPEDSADYKQTIINALKMRTGYDASFRVTLPNSKIKYIRGITKVKYDNNGQAIYMFGTTLDVTKENQMQELLLQKDKMRILGQLAGGLAHDFNNLLAGIISGAEALKLNPDLSEDEKIAVKNIIQAGIGSAGLIKQLLNFSRQSIIKSKNISLDESIDAALQIFKQSISPEIRICVDTENHDLMVNGDYAQFQAVLLNLLLNARDALAGILDPMIELKVHREQEEAVISIKDNGELIPSQVLKNIFDPFFTTKSRKENIGLGLTMVKNSLEVMQGEIAFSSSKKNGTEVILRLLLAVKAKQRDKRKLPDKGSANILLVDDDRFFTENLSILLKKKGYSVSKTPSAASAIEIMSHNEIDVVISDVLMPDISGYEFVRSVRRQNKSVRIIILTGHLGETPIPSDIQDMTDSILYKPLEVEELMDAITAQRSSER